jgi:hypothetical protein
MDLGYKTLNTINGYANEPWHLYYLNVAQAGGFRMTDSSVMIRN